MLFRVVFSKAPSFLLNKTNSVVRERQTDVLVQKLHSVMAALHLEAVR